MNHTTNTEQTNELQYAYRLANIPGIGARTLHKLVRTASPKALFEDYEPRNLDTILTEKQQTSFAEAKKDTRWKKSFEGMMQNGIRFTYYDADDFPDRLRDIPDPPFCLYYRGMLPSDDVPAVSIIGARICSEYGRYSARKFGTELAAAGVQIISGMALGVDGIAQKGALAAGGSSFAVLGCGVDICYPEENRSLYDALPSSGGILSEYPIGTNPEARLFPVRNRIISGLSDAVLVIEARAKSGTLITVDMALEQGRDVYALPGRVTDRLSDGCNKLIRQGAGIAFTPQDVLDGLFGITTGGMNGDVNIQKEHADVLSEGTPSPGQAVQPPSTGGVSKRRTLTLSHLEEVLLRVVDIEPLSVGRIHETLMTQGHDFAVPQLMNTLMELCFKGFLQQEGGYFMRRLG